MEGAPSPDDEAGAVVGMTSDPADPGGSFGTCAAGSSAPTHGSAALSSTAANSKPLLIDIYSPTNGSLLDCPHIREFAVTNESGLPGRIVSDSARPV
jgi:hypothetical protein